MEAAANASIHQSHGDVGPVVYDPIKGPPPRSLAEQVTQIPRDDHERYRYAGERERGDGVDDADKVQDLRSLAWSVRVDLVHRMGAKLDSALSFQVKKSRVE